MTSCWTAPTFVEGARADAISLAFSVTADEEEVQLIVVGPRTIDLGVRSHHYLLLTLARNRLADSRRGLPESACGWLHVEDFAHDPSMAPHRMNLDVFRIRQQFASNGIVDATNIVERRRLSRQIRIGTSNVSITTI